MTARSALHKAYLPAGGLLKNQAAARSDPQASKIMAGGGCVAADHRKAA